jgi:hypothetical protein
MITISDAILSLHPAAEFVMEDDNYEKIRWVANKPEKCPTKSELHAEVSRLINEHKRNEYQRLRAKEYPPVTDYLDAVVKGDQEQIDRYIAACLAVKAKYPKPE